VRHATVGVVIPETRLEAGVRLRVRVRVRVS